MKKVKALTEIKRIAVLGAGLMGHGIAQVAAQIGKYEVDKETVLVKKDSLGFIVNRILIPVLNEAVAIYWEGIADRDDIDKAVKLGLNWPMDPLMLLDHIGSDTTLAIAEVLAKELDPKFHPTTGLKQIAKAQLLGRKTGRGFYDWTQK